MAKLKAQTLLALVSNLVRRKAKITEARQTDATLGDSPSAYQKASKFLQLSEDVLRIIADSMRPGDRARVLQTCRYLHFLLERVQYRRLHLTESWGGIRTYRLLDTLWGRPELIPCIISYRGALVPYVRYKQAKLTASDKLKLRLARKQIPPPPSSVIPFDRAEAFQRSIFVFTKAVNIRELAFTDFSDWLSAPTWQPLRAALSNMSLIRFTLPSASETVEAVSLLRAQPKLEHLELLCHASGLRNLKETDIPNLKSLEATLNDAAIIVPGRPVEDFRQVPQIGERGVNEQLVRKLSLSSATITNLTTHFNNPWDSDSVRFTLQVLARHLPAIEHLTITVGGTVSGRILLDEIPSFQSLRYVRFLDADLLPEWSSTSAASVHDGGDEIAVRIPVVNNWDVLFSRLGELCPLLVDTEYTPRLISYRRSSTGFTESDGQRTE